MQVKEQITIKQIRCYHCNKYYKPNQDNKLTKCSYCQKPFTEKPIQVTSITTLTKEKCPKCNHTFRPRIKKVKPVCPKCHTAL